HDEPEEDRRQPDTDNRCNGKSKASHPCPCHACSVLRYDAPRRHRRPFSAQEACGRMPGMTAPAPLRPIAYGTPRIVCEKAPDGTLRCRSTALLGAHDPSLAQLFRAAVERNPSGLFLAERDAAGGWHKLSYEQARPLVDALAASLVERGLSPQRPVMVLSG